MRADVAMLLTPPGTGAIAVVRLSGPRTQDFLQTHFSKPVAQGRCAYGELRDGERVVDDCVVVLGPGSVFADVNIHGGPWVIRAVLDLARRSGFQVIERPDLPLPDTAVDATDEIEREVLAHLPLARTELGVRTLLAQPLAWSRLRQQIAAGISPDLRRQIAHMLEDRSLWHMLHPPRVAIIGAPNVGKSTLANQLFAREHSITADLPGTTRDWVGEIANIDGLPIMLVDTPGLRDATDAIERTALDQAAEQISTADLLVLVLDQSMPLECQRELLDRYRSSLVVLNKVDRPALWQMPAVQAIRTVATTGEGIDALRLAIRTHFDCDTIDTAKARCWTQRQRDQIIALPTP